MLQADEVGYHRVVPVFHIDDSIAVLWLGWDCVQRTGLNTKNSVTCRIPRWNQVNSQSKVQVYPEIITDIYSPFRYFIRCPSQDVLTSAQVSQSFSPSNSICCSVCILNRPGIGQYRLRHRRYAGDLSRTGTMTTTILYISYIIIIVSNAFGVQLSMSVRDGQCVKT